MALPKEFEDVIQRLSKRGEEKARVAEAQGIGEAQRRGFINPTGTSDIEFALRRSKTEPIREATEGSIASILAQVAEAERARGFQTSEREAGQQFGTQERLGSEAFAGEQAGKQRGFLTSE